ncbi:MAG TPA: YegP family protein [Candidatus Nanoarchaeia archaeon]|nr:YegP family protein [Candidatus Nanoarchaeia archaeon]
MKAALKIIVKKSSKNNQWYFSIVSRNGKIMAQSEGYKKESNVLKSIQSLKNNLFLSDTIVIRPLRK